MQSFTESLKNKDGLFGEIQGETQENIQTRIRGSLLMAVYCQKQSQSRINPTNQALPFENQSYKNNPAKIKASHNSSSIGLAADMRCLIQRKK